MFALKGRSFADPTINMSASAASKLHTRRIDSNAICLNRIVAGWNNPTEVHAAPLLRRRLQFQTPQILSACSPHTLRILRHGEAASVPWSARSAFRSRPLRLSGCVLSKILILAGWRAVRPYCHFCRPRCWPRCRPPPLILGKLATNVQQSSARSVERERTLGPNEGSTQRG